MQAVCASTGPEALQNLRTAAREGKPYDVALLDLQMPEMDGLALARAVRADVLLAGTRLAPGIIRRTGTPPVTAAGFVLSAAALGLAATTGVHTGYGFTAAWLTVLGAGLGLALPAAMNAAIGALSAERAGSGSGGSGRAWGMRWWRSWSGSPSAWSPSR